LKRRHVTIRGYVIFRDLTKIAPCILYYSNEFSLLLQLLLISPWNRSGQGFEDAACFGEWVCGCISLWLSVCEEASHITTPGFFKGKHSGCVGISKRR